MSEMNSKKTILIVDDVYTNRALLERIFADDFTVLLAENGDQAIKTLRENNDICLMILDLVMPVMDGYEVLNLISGDENLNQIPVVVITASDEADNLIRALNSGATDVITKPFNPRIVFHRVQNILARKDADKLTAQNQLFSQLLKQSEIDDKTGIYSRQAFCRHTAEILKNNPNTEYVLVRWDLDRFKVFNDTQGMAAGDKLLAHIGEYYRNIAKTDKAIISYGHWDADHFVTCRKAEGFKPDELLRALNYSLVTLYPGYEFATRFGIYKITDNSLDVAIMCDRAYLALRSIKNEYSMKYAYYDDSMLNKLIEEQQIVSEMENALENGQFLVYFQPIFNYDENELVTAEALVRWNHPEKGLIAPGKFIPVFEKNGFIGKLDKYVFEETCRLQKKWLDSGIEIVPVSVNISRQDIYNTRLCAEISEITEKYNLDHKYIRIEITESAYMDNPEQLIIVVKNLQKMGFLVEMDDFGSGYSSLNMLKDVPVDILKLDMRFLSLGSDNSRGGNILSSVIRMAHWLQLPVIAEGVETDMHANYLKSLGCRYMQGYYFSKPIKQESFEELLKTSIVENEIINNVVDIDGISAFWDYSEHNANIFSNYVTSSVIVEYYDESVEIRRANDMFFKEIGISRNSFEKYDRNILPNLSPTSQVTVCNLLDNVIISGHELSDEFCYDFQGEVRWIKCSAKLLARCGDSFIFLVTVENITELKNSQYLYRLMTERFKLLSKTIDIINFEYSADKDEIKIFSKQPDGSDKEETFSGFIKDLVLLPCLDEKQAEKIRMAFVSALQKPIHTDIEYLSSRFGGNEKLCKMHIASVSDDISHVSKIIGYITDTE